MKKYFYLFCIKILLYSSRSYWETVCHSPVFLENVLVSFLGLLIISKGSSVFSEFSNCKIDVANSVKYAMNIRKFIMFLIYWVFLTKLPNIIIS